MTEFARIPVDPVQFTILQPNGSMDIIGDLGNSLTDRPQRMRKSFKVVLLSWRAVLSRYWLYWHTCFPYWYHTRDLKAITSSLYWVSGGIHIQRVTVAFLLI